MNTSPTIDDVKNSLTNMHIPELTTRFKYNELNKLYPILAKIIEVEVLELRHKAIQLAVTVNPERGISFILPYLNDEDENIRLLVVGLLGDNGDESVITPVVQRLTSDPDATVRLWAAAVLARIGNLETIPHLEKALADTGEDYEGRSVGAMAAESIQSIKERFKP